jgi:DNA-binding transcriptional ArsR family regulator
MSNEHIDHTFAALADPTRRRIVELLAGGDNLRVGDLAARFDTSRQAVTRHLDILCEAGLVDTRRCGRERISRISPGAFLGIHDWLSHYDRFWDEKLQDLKALIEGREEP